MLNDFGGAYHIYIKCGRTDLRMGIDGLAALVKQEMELDPFSNALFLFCGRRSDRIKALYWEGNGFVLLYKRLESGSFQWPRKESKGTHTPAIPLAHGGPERGPAQGAQAGFRSGNDLRNCIFFCTFCQKYAIIIV